jgi:hypothetical protein
MSELYLQVEPFSEHYGLIASIFWNFKTVYGTLLHFVGFLCNCRVYSDTGQITILFIRTDSAKTTAGRTILFAVPEVAYAVNFIDLLMMDTECVRNM